MTDGVDHPDTGSLITIKAMKLGLAYGLHNSSHHVGSEMKLSDGNHACFVSKMSRRLLGWLRCVLLEQ